MYVWDAYCLFVRVFGLSGSVLLLPARVFLPPMVPILLLSERAIRPRCSESESSLSESGARRSLFLDLDVWLWEDLGLECLDLEDLFAVLSV